MHNAAVGEISVARTTRYSQYGTWSSGDCFWQSLLASSYSVAAVFPSMLMSPLLHGAGKAAKTGARFEPSLPKPATSLSSMGPSPGQMSLEQAVAKTRELLFSLSNVEPSQRVALLTTHQEETGRELETARQDPATKREAVALTALLAAFTRDFAESAAMEEARSQSPDAKPRPELAKPRPSKKRR